MTFLKNPFLLLAFYFGVGFISNVIFQLLHQQYRNLDLMNRVYSQSLFNLIPGNAISDDVIVTILLFFILIPTAFLIIVSGSRKIIKNSTSL